MMQQVYFLLCVLADSLLCRAVLVLPRAAVCCVAHVMCVVSLSLFTHHSSSLCLMHPSLMHSLHSAWLDWQVISVCVCVQLTHMCVHCWCLCALFVFVCLRTSLVVIKPSHSRRCLLASRPATSPRCCGSHVGQVARGDASRRRLVWLAENTTQVGVSNGTTNYVYLAHLHHTLTPHITLPPA